MKNVKSLGKGNAVLTLRILYETQFQHGDNNPIALLKNLCTKIIISQINNYLATAHDKTMKQKKNTQVVV